MIANTFCIEEQEITLFVIELYWFTVNYVWQSKKTQSIKEASKQSAKQYLIFFLIWCNVYVLEHSMGYTGRQMCLTRCLYMTVYRVPYDIYITDNVSVVEHRSAKVHCRNMFLSFDSRFLFFSSNDKIREADWINVMWWCTESTSVQCLIPAKNFSSFYHIH